MFRGMTVPGYVKGAGMLYAMLLLGLIPAVLLPDFLSTQDASPENGDEPVHSPDNTVDLLDDPDETGREIPLEPVIEDDEAGEEGADELVLQPIVEDDLPEAEVTVLYPVIEDDLPSPTPPGDPEDALAPVVEDDIDQGYSDPPAEDVLQPVIEDDIAGEGSTDQPLPPVIEDDVAATDTAAPQVEDDEPSTSEAWLDASDLAAGSYAEIEGFEVGTDVLRISLDQDHGLPHLDVDVELAANGTDTEVLIGDTLFATILDATGVSPQDIIVQIQRIH